MHNPKSHHRQPEFDPRIVATTKGVLTLILTLTEELPPLEDFKREGRVGVRGKVQGHRVGVGNRDFLATEASPNPDPDLDLDPDPDPNPCYRNLTLTLTLTLTQTLTLTLTKCSLRVSPNCSVEFVKSLPVSNPITRFSTCYCIRSTQRLSVVNC